MTEVSRRRLHSRLASFSHVVFGSQRVQKTIVKHVVSVHLPADVCNICG